MLQTIGAVVVLLLAVYGCMEGVRRLCAWLMYPPCNPQSALVLWFCGHDEDVELTVRCAAARYRDRLPIYAVENATDAQTHALLQRVCGVVRDVELLTVEEFSARFFEKV